LDNPDTALRCDCGFDFASGTIQEWSLDFFEAGSSGRFFGWPESDLSSLGVFGHQ